jgi:hypothetical protein
MTSHLPVVKNSANGAILYTALAAQTANGAFQANPTLAAGDVKISLDGGAFANLNTLPAVTPAGGKAVKITLSQAETNADNIVILFSDAAGAEWSDQMIEIQTVAKSFDDIPAAAPTAAAIRAEMDSNSTKLTNLDAAVSSRLAASGYTAPDNASITAIKAKTDNLPASPAATGDIPSAADIRAEIDSNSTQLAAILADTAEIGAAGAGLTALGDTRVANLDAAISTRLAAADYTAPDNAGIAAIKIKTDNLPSDPADQSLVVAATDAIMSRIGAPAGASIADDIAAVPTADQNAAGLLDLTAGVETGLTLRQHLRLSAAVLFGKASGWEGTQGTFRDLSDTKDRVTATVDENGNRSAVTLDAS